MKSVTTPTNPPPLDTIVYSRSGQRAKYVCSVLGKYSTEHYVKPEVEFGLPDGDADTSFEGAAIWHEFFLSPPRDVIDKEIAQLEAKVEELQAAVNKLGREHAEAERDIITRKVRLARHDQLKRLDDFITKGVSCYVIDHDYGRIDIVDFKDTKAEHSHAKFRMLSLFGNSDGDLEWHINQYADASGSSYVCIPCSNRDEAKLMVAQMLEWKWAKWRKDKGFNHLDTYAANARKHGVPVPEDIAAELARREAEAKEKAVEAARKTFVAAQAALMKAEEGVVSRMGVAAKTV